MGLRRRRLSSQSSSELLDPSTNSKTNHKPCQIAYAKKKKPERLGMITLQVSAVVVCFTMLLFTYLYFEFFHYNLVHFYATRMNDHHAQHTLGHKLLKNGQNMSAAFHWFRKSADNGHPHSAYNLAAGHLSGYQTDVEKGEVKKLLRFAAENGVEEALRLLEEVCEKKAVYCEH